MKMTKVYVVYGMYNSIVFKDEKTAKALVELFKNVSGPWRPELVETDLIESLSEVPIVAERIDEMIKVVKEKEDILITFKNSYQTLLKSLEEKE